MDVSIEVDDEGIMTVYLGKRRVLPCTHPCHACQSMQRQQHSGSRPVADCGRPAADCAGTPCRRRRNSLGHPSQRAPPQPSHLSRTRLMRPRPAPTSTHSSSRGRGSSSVRRLSRGCAFVARLSADRFMPAYAGNGIDMAWIDYQAPRRRRAAAALA
jgi:hypothetical protein